MSNKILVPALGESITEATVSKWLKTKGDKVSSDEPLVELETDKVNVEVPAPSNGVLETISAREGETVNVGAILGTVGQSKASSADTQTEKDEKIIKDYKPPKKNDKILKKKVDKTEVPSEAPMKLLDEEISNGGTEAEPLVLTEELTKPTPKRTKNISPSARKLATESNLNINNIEGSGKNGLILKEDVMALMGVKPKPSERKITYGPEERIRMTRLRMTIAKRLKEAQENAAMLTTFNEVDMSEVISMRNQYKDEFKNQYSVKLGFMSFFVKASIIGLKNFPAINSEIQGDEIVYKNYYNVSIAVGTDKGLVVPVIKNADEKSFADIEKKIGELGQKARDGKITIEDLQGGTFTITNGGIYGSMLSTPILNPPQSAVLGMHNIIERPTNVDGEVKIRPIMYLALSYDHRIIDGKEAVSFLKIVKESLEQPKRLFLNL